MEYFVKKNVEILNLSQMYAVIYRQSYI